MDAVAVARMGSLRSGSSSIWKADEIFSRSAHEEDDEEALKWAALEKLPTYSRLRKGLLTMAEGGGKEIDIEDLGFEERKELLERLVRVAEEDNEKFLRKLRDRMDRVGIELPTIEVRYEHLSIEAEAYVGNRGLPTLFNSIINIFETVANCLHILPNKKKPLTILHDISGVIKPRRMTLLLGPPGSGKTTLLLALAGKLDSDVKVSGRVTYNGHGMNEFVPQRTAAYISQYDLHIGEMTVRETLSFSARCQGVGTRYDMLSELARREKAANIKPDPDIDVFMKATSMEGQKTNIVTDYVLKILGLDICADTMVGDDMRRGISGGQRKRVTTGEMIVGPAKALFMDEISTGLDSSTTYQIVNSLKQSIHILDGTAVISLLQPAPETFDLFDDIILISDGQVVYHGPREHVLEFFESLGFKCPERKGVADFLQEVTSKKDQQQYWQRHNEPYRFVPVREFAEAFQSFHVGEKLTNELSVPYDKSKEHPAALTISKYGVSTKELLKACFSREYLLMKRNSFVYGFRGFQEMKAKGIQEDRLELLKGVSGSFRPGVLTALMGVSGAGKTTLMDVLAGRKTGGYIEGSIMINGYPKKQETFARVSGYCEQNDIHSPYVTVYESLVYSAWLRLPAEVGSEKGKVGDEKYSMFIEEIMELVELTPLRGALVGLPGVNGLSTEQRKRLTIAVELVANPAIIFMDEPTSGLDARAAAIVMRTVRNTVDTGRTVVCTIHQPSIDIFEAFDEDLFNAMGSMYASVLFLGISNASSVQPVVSVERTVFYRERAAGMYSALPYAFGQRMPVWWRWYSWACPVAWTLYGLVASQFGDLHETFENSDVVISQFIRSYFGFKHDFLGVVAVVVVGFAALFAFLFGFAIKALNFQRR
ncbi:Pleiotropic drug resistance protein 1 [Dendrobium catenatum]|uniref:Pleiotropic drug resistance protein 1 n=1 Tax=Dendrobium catenatum TaxID=906689 RepID=A0A2I0W9I2_9ASPA|nr:Pleiotropic drug resistance protein 1 [Dendrobium catenatum]